MLAVLRCNIADDNTDHILHSNVLHTVFTEKGNEIFSALWCFNLCSKLVKLRLFRSRFCVFFYGVALWKNFTKGSLNKLRSCYRKRIKIFFGYPKFHSVTATLLELSLPCFCTLVHNSQYRFSSAVDQLHWQYCQTHEVCWH